MRGESSVFLLLKLTRTRMDYVEFLYMYLLRLGAYDNMVNQAQPTY